MIDFINGKIFLGGEQISLQSPIEYLNSLLDKLLINKIETETSRQISFCAESVQHEDMRFGVGIRYLNNRITWIILRWLDGPCTSRGWDGVNNALLKEEYSLLSAFLEKQIKKPPSNKKNRENTWELSWGKLNISYDSRAFEVRIFMEPN